MKYEFPIYLKHLHNENIQWISLSAINTGFMDWNSNQFIDYDKLEIKQFDRDVDIYATSMHATHNLMTCDQILFILQDYISNFYYIDNAKCNMKMEYIFIKTIQEN